MSEEMIYSVGDLKSFWEERSADLKPVFTAMSKGESEEDPTEDEVWDTFLGYCAVILFADTDLETDSELIDLNQGLMDEAFELKLIIDGLTTGTIGLREDVFDKLLQELEFTVVGL